MGYAVRCKVCRQGVLERKKIPRCGNSLAAIGYLILMGSALACLLGFIVWMTDYVPQLSAPYPEREERLVAENLSVILFIPGIAGVFIGLIFTAKMRVIQCSTCHVVSRAE